MKNANNKAIAPSNGWDKAMAYARTGRSVGITLVLSLR
jgi:hypothetical protein